MPNIQNILEDLWNHMGFNDRISQQVSNPQQSNIIQVYLYISDRTLHLPTGTTVKRGAVIEIVGQTPTLISNGLFTSETMHEIMNFITERI